MLHSHKHLQNKQVILQNNSYIKVLIQSSLHRCAGFKLTKYVHVCLVNKYEGWSITMS